MSLDEFKGRVWAFRQLMADVPTTIKPQRATSNDSARVVRMKIRLDADRAGWNVPALDPDAHLGARGGE